MRASEASKELFDAGLTDSIPSPATVGEMIARSAACFGAAPALLAAGRPPISHSDLASLLEACAAQLHGAGLRASDRVAVALPKSVENAVLCLALASVCCCVPLNPESTAADFRAALRRTRCRFVVAPEGSVAWQCGAALGLTCLGFRWPAAGGFELAGLPEPSCASREPAPEPGADDVAVLLHTSGSSATPKLVQLSHRALLSSAGNVVRSLALGPADRCLNMMPLFHVGALVDLLLAPLSVGGSVVVTGRITAAQFFAALREFTPSWYQGVPTMLRELVAIAQLEPQRLGGRRLRLIRAVSSALSERLQHEIEAVFGCPVVAIYGMTETAGLITSNPLPPGVARPGSVGICAGPEVRVRRADGAWARAGESGEICVRGPTVMQDYEASGTPRQEHFHAEWLRTGDLGHFDADGYLFLSGRSKDIVNRGGEKIAPLEIDCSVLEHPEVAQAAAFGVPHPSLGEELALAVVTAPGSQLDQDAIREFLRPRLAPHKLPRQVYLLDALPLGRTGKVQRRALSERFATPRAGGAWRPPETPNAQALADLWRRALRVERVGMDDDFFDLGGDSLTAASLMLDLNALTGISVPAGMLYEHPTPRAFLRALETLPKSAELSLFLASEQADTGLPPALYAALSSTMSAWGGTRSHPHSLIVGHRLGGVLQPFFWVVNGHEELRETLHHLDPQRPVYGMRSLFGTDGDSAANRRALGEHLAREIAQLQETGPILLGGFCSGGRVALEIARALRGAGREVALLCLLDTNFHKFHDGDVLLFHTRKSFFRPMGQFVAPRRGWTRYYRGRVAEVRVNVRHSVVLKAGHSRWFGTQLDQALRTYEAGQTAWLPPAAALPILPDDAYRAHISCDPPRRWSPGSRVSLRVELRNTSRVTWHPTEHSGLLLGARLRHAAAARRRDPGKGRRLRGYAPLPAPLGPGTGVVLDLTVRARLRPGRYVLEIDMVDDGVAWFGDRGCTPFETPVHVLPGAGLINRLEHVKRKWNPR